MKLVRALASTAILLAGCTTAVPPRAPATAASPPAVRTLIVSPAAAPAPAPAAPAPAPAAPPAAAAAAAAAPAPAQVAATATNTTTPPPAPVAASAPRPAPPPAPALPPPAPFDEAVQLAANSLFSNAPLPPGGRQMVVIDPLVDGVSGMESTATRTMEDRLVEVIKSRYSSLDVQPFNAANVKRSPWVLIGTFTPINTGGQAAGPRDAYRICLALADLSTGKIVSKGFARAKPDGVDITPTRFYQDSPAWRPETLTEGYVKTCQGTKAGDPINPVYLDGIIASSDIAEGTAAYQSGKYREALDHYRAALALPQGRQLRAFNGLYLALHRMRQPEAAQEAFGAIVTYGLANRRIAMRLLFRPGSTDYLEDPTVSGSYAMWVNTLARQAVQGDSCIEVVGHTSKTGSEPTNERLSQQRAEAVRRQMVAVAPALAQRTTASGVGSRETLVGIGTDDQRDALDRRVVFAITGCASS